MSCAPLAYDETNRIWLDRPLARNLTSFARENLSQMEFSLSERSSIYPIPGAIVRSPVRLSSRVIRGLDLREAKFNRGVWLVGLSFKGSVNLSSSVFHRGLFVNDCIFDSEISFYEALFHSYVIFVNVRIGGFAQFRNSVFNGRTVFRDVRFDAGARFRRCRFWGKVEFGDSHFSRQANFFNTIFGNDVSFRNTAFNSTANFGHSTYYSDADFSCSGASKSDNPDSARFEVREFNATMFGGRAIFNNRTFTEPTSFWKTIFIQAPEFHGANLPRNGFPARQSISGHTIARSGECLSNT